MVHTAILKDIKISNETLDKIGADNINNIIDFSLANVTCNVSNPVMYAVSGGIGSGKSTLANILLREDKLPKTAFLYDPDITMDMIPQYREDIAEIGPIQAFLKWEPLAHELAKAIAIHVITELRADVIYSKTFSSEKSLEFLKKLIEDYKYRTIMHIVHLEKDKALERINLKEHEKWRENTPEVVKERLENLKKLLPIYIKILEDWLVYDNNIDEDNPQKIAEKYKDSNINIIDYDKYSDFVDFVLGCK